MGDDYQRYVDINLPHSRAVIVRIGRTLEFLGAFREGANGGAAALHAAFEALEREADPYDDDPALEAAVAAADAVAGRARTLVAAIQDTPVRSDRLGQHVRNLFECLGLAGEGAALSLQCGERPDSPLRG
ncbi:MAG TPA: hypothetical protein VMR21_04100 [Vicinamibacteria bacterium]|nr:hypothetical protein [Vicinamibacteria bacterium]